MHFTTRTSCLLAALVALGHVHAYPRTGREAPQDDRSVKLTPVNVTNPSSADPSSIELPTIKTSDAADCGVAIGPKCYYNLVRALEEAEWGSTIVVSEDQTIKEEIKVSNSLTIVGRGRPTITVDITDARATSTAIRMTGDGQELVLSNLKFANVGKYGSAVRSPELGDGEYPEDPSVTSVLTVLNCDFNKFRTGTRGGATIHLGMTDKLIIHDTSIREGIVEDFSQLGKIQYEGGGSVWVANLFGPVSILNSEFSDNANLYPHGLGGALTINFVNGNIDIIDSVFSSNKGAEGGALYIGGVEKGQTVKLDSTFEDNVSVYTEGWSNKGGAAVIQFINGTVHVGGTFSNNVAQNDRGGAIANNRIREEGKVTIAAKFGHNTCGKGAAVWDTLQEFATGVSLTIDGSTSMTGNKAYDGLDLVVRLRSVDNGFKNIYMYESEWDGDKMTFPDDRDSLKGTIPPSDPVYGSNSTSTNSTTTITARTNLDES
eukprot:comp22924_c0_seq1/m.36288 comp22924_c0_seq1/g.36288  ORF comp22924_c0_seq1/g.36288 comp22924_c0_seq1/m.36288 type:complete len:488 (-) comp22924_c0_seq1:1664-3127(-)